MTGPLINLVIGRKASAPAGTEVGAPAKP
jgi:hypothetical protein